MENNKKNASKKAKIASKKLREESREKKTHKKDVSSMKKHDKTYKEVNYIKSEEEYSARYNETVELRKAKRKELEDSIKADKLHASESDAKLSKFDQETDKILSKEDKKRQSAKIKDINKSNKKPKGKRLIKPSSRDTIIEVRNITKTYVTKSLIFNALNDVSVEIKRGEFIVILGPSGSGKSTLLNLISGLDRPTKGEVIIDGHNIVALSDNELTKFRRDKIGFVFQSYNLLSTLNVSDNVEIGRALQKDRSKKLSIDKTLKSIKMLDQEKKKVFELSGGQQQRVSIARALVKNPDILIGDEPTGALDSVSRKDVFKLFQEVNKEYGTTIIIVTHNPRIADLANKVIKIKDGQIDELIVNKKQIDASNL